MHHKFAIIDYQTVITGSYNWTKQARRNEENIVVIRDIDQAEAFVEKFESLKEDSTFFPVLNRERKLEASFTTSKIWVDKGQKFHLSGKQIVH